MLHIALYEPEIPPNTGNIIRLCANMGAKLHLIHPLGFELDEKRLRRAGLDYREFMEVAEYPDYATFQMQMQGHRLFACSTKGIKNYTEMTYQDGDCFLFGPETRGLPASVRDPLSQDRVIRIPMLANSRSLNLSNAVAIIAYEAWRQLDFKLA